MKKVSIADVARKAGVSNATVSYAISGNGRVAESTQKKVMKAVEELGFIRDEAAVRLRTGRSNLIGAIFNDITNPFFTELAAELENSAYKMGYLTIISTAQNDLKRQRQLISSMISQGVAGVMISPVHGTVANDLEPLNARDIPHVVCVRGVEGARGRFVGLDESRAGQMQAQHLIDRGHRKIVYVGGHKNTANWGLRYAGIMLAVERSDRAVSLEVVPGFPTREFGCEIAERVIRASKEMVGFVCFNDAVAIGTYQAAYAVGLKVGQDLSIVGLDNIPQSNTLLPGLTTIEVFIRRMGLESAQHLIAKIRGKETPDTPLLMTPELIERESVSTL